MPSDTLTALITGASSGIGLAFAHLFARDGYNLILVARRADALEQLAADITATHKVSVTVRAVDLSDLSAAVAFVDDLEQQPLAVDVLVNNAGFAMRGAFDQLPLDRQLEMITLNVTTLTMMTRRLLPAMRVRGRGGILNVGSTAAFQAGPFMAVYYATKAYVVSFTEALSEEVFGSALRVSCLAPGPTHTGFASAAGATDSGLFSGQVMDVEEVARLGYEGWKAGQRLIVPGRENRLRMLAVRLLPRGRVLKAVRKLNE